MATGTQVRRKYGDAAGYDSYMGGWSAALSPLFVAFAGVRDGASVADIGCGTGNLLAAVAAACPQAGLIGIDPATALLAKARQRPELAGATLIEGSVEQLPLSGSAVDFVLSMLVLQEFTDRSRALSEMRRVVRPGGVVAACQWDFRMMPVIDTLMQAITDVSPAAAQRIGRTSPPVFVDEAELLYWWQRGGFIETRATRLTVTRIFPAFDDLWSPLLAGSTPSTLALAGLPPTAQEEVRQKLLGHFASGTAGDPIAVTAEALAVSGLAP
jgi:SAM-dependent methyltransferase